MPVGFSAVSLFLRSAEYVTSVQYQTSGTPVEHPINSSKRCGLREITRERIIRWKRESERERKNEFPFFKIFKDPRHPVTSFFMTVRHNKAILADFETLYTTNYCLCGAVDVPSVYSEFEYWRGFYFHEQR